MRRTLLGLALVAWPCLAAAQTPPQALPPAGDVLARNCLTCHGSDGRGVDAIPPIGGYAAEAIVVAMQDFQSGRRPATIMNRIARGYSEEQIKAIAAWLERIK